MAWAILIFLCSLLLSVVASIVLTRRLEQLGGWLLFSESLLGIVVALGADAPEISSAVTAMHGGRHDLGVGIVIGSNIFNLAALLGLSAVVSGKVCVERKTLLWDGGVAALVLAVVAVQLYGVLGGGWALCPIAVIMVPYVVITALPPWFIYKVAGRIGLGGMIGETVAAADKDAKRPEKPPRPSTADLLRSISALVAIVVASLGLVHAAITLGAAGHVPDAVLGTLVLASLTGIPNVVAAVKLAMKSRGSAVLSESLNSNTLNLIAGASIPAVVLGIAVLSASVIIALWWMIGMTLLALFLCGLRGGLGRTRGAVLIVLYGAFVVVVLYRG